MRLDRKPWFEVTEAGLTWPAKYFSAEACFHPNDAYDLNHFPSIFLHFYMMHMTWKHDHLPYIFLHFSRLLEMLFMEILSFNGILELNTWQIGPYWTEDDDIICAALKVLLCVHAGQFSGNWAPIVLGQYTRNQMFPQWLTYILHVMHGGEGHKKPVLSHFLMR